MKQNDGSIQIRLHNRQLLLFLIAVVLPCSVLIVLTWHVVGQQKELSVKRRADERQRLAEDIGQKLLFRLENIKLHEVSGASGGLNSLNTFTYSSSEVILVALTDGRRLWLPWEIEPSSNTPLVFDSKLTQKLRLAEQEEFAHQQWIHANELYSECIDEANGSAQKTYIRLLRARLLAKSGDMENSLTEYRSILEVSSAVIDEHGIPFRLYAMIPLIERGDWLDRILAILTNQLNAVRWFSPAEAYLIQDTLDRLIESSNLMESQRLTVRELHESILKHIHKQEIALSLQKAFPRWTLLPQWRTSQEKSQSVWLPYSREPLLIGLAPAIQGERRLLIAVQGQKILDAVISDTPYAKASLMNLNLNMDTDLHGASLGSRFPGVDIVFDTDVLGSSGENGFLQRHFYFMALVVVLFVALFGAYFLWRDVTRELRLAEMRSQFIASVSHELKTPLTAIRIFAETLRLGRAKNSQAQSEYLDTIVNESHRLTRLLNNVLDFSKIEKGKRIYHLEPVLPGDIIRAAAEAMQYPLMQRDFQLKVSIEDNLPDIYVDRDAIEQALLNLLSNAMKFSGESREIELTTYHTDHHVIMEVKDQGIGIEPAEQARIFEKFHRVASQENERIPGTGLGLALVAHIVEAHNGRIEVQSQPGEGSTFGIYLPLEKSHESNSHC